MLSKFLSQVNKEWEDIRENPWVAITEILVCEELGEILKDEGFDFKFSPHEYNQIEDEVAEIEVIPVIVEDIDQMYFCRVE